MPRHTGTLPRVATEPPYCVTRVRRVTLHAPLIAALRESMGAASTLRLLTTPTKPTCIWIKTTTQQVCSRPFSKHRRLPFSQRTSRFPLRQFLPQTASAEGLFTLGDARSSSGLTSKIPPLGSMLHFDADVKKTSARQQCENRLRYRPGSSAGDVFLKKRFIAAHDTPRLTTSHLNDGSAYRFAMLN